MVYGQARSQNPQTIAEMAQRKLDERHALARRQAQVDARAKRTANKS